MDSPDVVREDPSSDTSTRPSPDLSQSSNHAAPSGPVDGPAAAESLSVPSSDRQAAATELLDTPSPASDQPGPAHTAALGTASRPDALEATPTPPAATTQQARVSRAEQLADIRRISRKVAALRLPEVFYATRFETLDPNLDPEAFRICEQYADAGHYRGRSGLLLMGPAGCGKTALAVAILRRTIDWTRGRVCASLCSLPRYLTDQRRLPEAAYAGLPRACTARYAACEGSASNQYCPDLDCLAERTAMAAAALVRDPGVPNRQYRKLLVLDDLRTAALTERAATSLHVLLDCCWSESRQVVVTTSETLAVLRAGLSAGTVSRLLATCHLVNFETQDLRQLYG